MSHLRDVVAPNMGDSLGVFLAAREPCIGMARKPPADRRRSVRVEPSQLDGVALPPSYAIAVVLCPGDDTTHLTRFSDAHGIPDDRVHFFYTPDTDVVEALAAWTGAGRRVLYSFSVRDWKPLNRLFGAFWNHWVHDDFCGTAGCRMH